MRVVVATNVLVSAVKGKKSIPGMAAHIVAESGVLINATITERELFVTPARPRLAPLIPPRFRDWLSGPLPASGRRSILRAQVRSSRSTSSAAAIFFSVSTVPLRSPFSICDRYPIPTPARTASCRSEWPRCSRHIRTGFSRAISR
jgi:hypothetical protein